MLHEHHDRLVAIMGNGVAWIATISASASDIEQWARIASFSGAAVASVATACYFICKMIRGK